MNSKKRVAYFYNSEIGNYNYGKSHFMNPKRISMTHSLIVGFGIYNELDVYTSREATKEEIIQYHDADYVEYLSNYVSSSKIDFLKRNSCSVPNIDETARNLSENQSKYGIAASEDCPGFDGVYTFSALSTGGSIDAAHLIINNAADIAINWGGGLHHAKKGSAFGFCYLNDIVVCILELLKVHSRILYIDIDVHHGDGVEEAFYNSNRVMTVSFHQHGEDFFPRTGDLSSIGEGSGRNYSINVPLLIGMNDISYTELFKNVIKKVMEVFRPEAIVFQTGADSLANDRIGGFNLSIRGHGECLTHMMSYNIPMVVLGGGGYTIENVSRCWAYETGLLVNQQLTGKIPIKDPYYHHYEKQDLLHVPIKEVENSNSKQGLAKIQEQVFKQLKEIEAVPNIPFHDVLYPFMYSDMDCHREPYSDLQHDFEMLDTYDTTHLAQQISQFQNMDLEIEVEDGNLLRHQPLLIQKHNLYNHI